MPASSSARTSARSPPRCRHMMAERPSTRTECCCSRSTPTAVFATRTEYPRRAIATVTTHDLPTLKGYWSASDIELRNRLALYPSDEVRDRVVQERTRDRAALLAALQEQGLAAGSGASGRLSRRARHAVHVYLARTTAALVVLQAEDLVGMADPVNVPGTSDEHANWQRKMNTQRRRDLRQRAGAGHIARRAVGQDQLAAEPPPGPIVAFRQRPAIPVKCIRFQCG